MSTPEQRTDKAFDSMAPIIDTWAQEVVKVRKTFVAKLDKLIAQAVKLRDTANKLIQEEEAEGVIERHGRHPAPVSWGRRAPRRRRSRLRAAVP